MQSHTMGTMMLRMVRMSKVSRLICHSAPCKLRAISTFNPAGLGGGKGKMNVIWLHATGLAGGCYRPLALKVNALLDNAARSSTECRIELVHHFPDQRAHGKAPPYSSEDCLWHEDNVSDITSLAEQIKACDGAPLFVVAHSMGAAVAMYAESRSSEPIFNGGGVLLEPIIPTYLLKIGSFVAPNPLVSKAKKRKSHWQDREEAGQFFAKRFASWDSSFVSAYVEHCLTSVGDGAAVQRLCSPEVEARTVSRLGPMVPPDNFRAGLGGRWHLLAGERSNFPPFIGGPGYYRKLAARYGAEFEVIPAATHFAPMEQPDAVAAIVARSISASCRPR